jgi:multiple sugar transport system ATP-binding protein
MGRAIVRKPQVFLMDEPLSNLDAKLRVSTRTQIASLQKRLGVTTVYVTHDQVEAMTMGDRVAVLKDGVLQQCDTPRALYDRPGNAFVAGFIGSPAMNLVQGRVVDGAVRVGAATIPVAPEEVADGAEVTAGFRPESLELVGAEDGFAAVVAVVEELGSDAYVYASFAGHESAAITEGHDIVVRVDPRQTPRPGDTVHLCVRPGELHLFDAATGSRLT